MAWHQKNSTNAGYTSKDASKSRPVCPSCVYGGMHQTRTSHHRQHRGQPTIPGQQFSLDAYTHTRASYRNHVYCDLLTDLATGRIYPIYTKDRSASELVTKVSIFFALHPSWQNQYDNVDRFIRLDPERNYRSEAFLQITASFGYRLERTPERDKHANGVAERTVGIIAVKTNIAMLNPFPSVPGKYWDLAMTYACDTHSFNPNSRINDSPYHYITGRHVDVTQLHPFFARCFVHIPPSERDSKIGDPRAYKAHFVGYDYTSILTKTYKVIEVYADGRYGKVRSSKDVIFDHSINFRSACPNDMPTDEAFLLASGARNLDGSHPLETRIRFAEHTAKHGPYQRNLRPYAKPPPSILRQPPDTNPFPAQLHRIDQIDPTQHERDSPLRGGLHRQALPPDADNIAQYWMESFTTDYNVIISAVEATHFTLSVTIADPTVPKTFWTAMKDPQWAAAIDKELTKFEVNKCFTVVPFTNQHLVPMMWLFNIKTDGTKKSRLVGRGDRMIPFIDFDPNAVYCGNVAASSIKIALVIAAMYKLVMRGGDLVGAYLVTQANPDFPVHIQTPQGYQIAEGMCIRAVGNLYGFPPAGQNFSKEFDKCLRECGYENTPWDPKFFFKWVNIKPIIVIAHSDDFRWFGPDDLISEWDHLVATFNKHKYEVTDATNKEFVGIHIYHDEDFNYYMDQTRMITSIVEEANIAGARNEKLPYPMHGPPLSKEDCPTTDEQKAKCSKYPYRKVVGQLMYGMVHTMVTIMYALNILSRYGNNPGPRHIEFLQHLLRYAKYSKADRLKFHTHDGPYDIETMTPLMQLMFQCDADLGGNKDNGHSQTSYLGYLAGSLICWCSTDQGSVSTSSAESEIKAVNHTLRSEVCADRYILNAMGWKQSPTVIEEDNAACVACASTPHITRNMRHIELAHHFLKEKTTDGTCIVTKVRTEDNNSDIGTKRVPLPLFISLTSRLVNRDLRNNL